MFIEQYDAVVLTDGRKASIVEKYSDSEFLADVGSGPKDWETIYIKLDEISHKIEKNKQSISEINIPDEWLKI